MTASILLMLAAAISGQQFDLVCTGQRHFDLLDQGTPTTFALHVDLAASRWCQDGCAAVLPIAEVQPTFIAFQRESAEEKARGQSNSMLVSRQTGKFLRYERTPQIGVLAIDATCTAAPFSGFPKPAVKF